MQPVGHEHILPAALNSEPLPQVPTEHVYPFEDELYELPVRKADMIAVTTVELVTFIPTGSFEPYKRKTE
jgi:hypothetical protein